MTDYKIESCHESGYGWEITAPDELTPEEVEALCNALIDWSDTLTTDKLREFLANTDLEHWQPLTNKRKALYNKVDLYADRVHTNSFTQSFEKVG